MKVPHPKKSRIPAALAAGIYLSSPLLFSATGVITGNAADAQVNSNAGVLSVSRVADTYDYIGGTNGSQSGVVHAFQIPAEILSDPSQQFTEATFKVKLGFGPGPTMPANGDLYGLGYGPSPTVTTGDYYLGSQDLSNTLIQDNFLTATTASYATVTNNSASLVAYLNQSLAAARADGLSTAYVFFRISPDAYVWYQRYLVAMAESGGATAPTLSYTSEAVSGWHPVPLGGGGYVIGMVSDHTGDNIYCRTDVGGAFRWNEASMAWEAMTDQLVPLGTPGAGGLLGISSLTLDPSLPQRLYLAAGLYTYSNPRGIYASEDGGDTWTQINSTVIVEGNGSFRATGERLVVDPNDSNTLWFGSIQQGLLKGTRSGQSWTWTTVPSTSVPFGNNKAGVTFVVCDKNGANTITYAGVYDNAGTTGGVYVTTDGSQWTKVAGDTLGTPSRGRLAADGSLYVSGGTKVGRIPRGGSLALLPGLPAGTTFGALATDLNDPTGETLYVAEVTGNRYGKILRTANGGDSWSTQFQNFNSGNLGAKNEPDGTPSVTGYWFGSIGALLVNPTKSEELWAGDFFGGYRTLNAGALGTTNGAFWNTLQKGIEETVPHALKNAPTGAKLLTGLADVNGYRYVDTTKRPAAINGGNTFSNPNDGSTSSLDFSEVNSSVWARTWVVGSHAYGSGGVSSDGGVTWLKFGQLAEKIVASNTTTSGWESWDVGTYLASQQAKGVDEVTLAVLSENSVTPVFSNSSIFFDSNNAIDSNVRPKLRLNGTTELNPTADTFVAHGAPTTNYGANTSLQVSYNYGAAAYTRWTYLKFNLQGVSPITSAALELNRRTVSTAITARVGVYAVNGTTWTESGLVWNNKPLTLASDGDPVAAPKQSVKGGRIAVSSTDPNRIVWLPEGTGNRARFSTDRGASWTVCTTGPFSQMQSQFIPGIIINQLTADRVNGKFYLANFNNDHRIYASSDGGETFNEVGMVNGGAYNVYRAQLVAAPAADHVWLSDDGVDTINGGGLWRSTDGGEEWTKIPGITKVSQVTFGKAASGTGYTVFINGKKDGLKTVYRSDNDGGTWTALAELPTIAPIEVMAGDRQNYGKVFIGVHGRGVYQGQ
jgi:hypothetical protein